jgi:hypothetical protein
MRRRGGVSPSPSLNGGDHWKKTRGSGRFPLSVDGGVSSRWWCSGVGKASTGAVGLSEPPGLSIWREEAPE